MKKTIFLVVSLAFLTGSIAFVSDAQTTDTSREAQTSGRNPPVTTSSQTTPGSDAEGPVTTTTVLKKQNPIEELNEWFADFGQHESVTIGHESIFEGYRAITFFTLAEGVLQRAVAIDLGNGDVLIHLTTDRSATTEELFKGAQQFIGEALTLQTTTTADSLACNCVLYARSQVPSLPTGITYYTQKLAIVNHRFPRVGSVAVIQIYDPSYAIYGHVAVVRNVAINFDGSLNLTIDESNYYHCQYSRRTGTPDKLNIRGYFDPAYPAGSSSPRLDSLSPSVGYAGTQFWTTAYGASFDPYSVRAIVLGGTYCTSFDRCVVPNGVITNKSTTNLKVPLTIGGTGTYNVYFFNSTSGKTSNGKPITIK